jgi:hypothetical protein
VSTLESHRPIIRGVFVVGKGGEWYVRSGRQSPRYSKMGGKINIASKKNPLFFALKNI